MSAPMSAQPSMTASMPHSMNRGLRAIERIDYYRCPESRELPPGDTAGLRATYDSYKVRTFLSSANADKRSGANVVSRRHRGVKSRRSSSSCSNSSSVADKKKRCHHQHRGRSHGVCKRGKKEHRRSGKQQHTSLTSSSSSSSSISVNGSPRPHRRHHHHHRHQHSKTAGSSRRTMTRSPRRSASQPKSPSRGRYQPPYGVKESTRMKSSRKSRSRSANQKWREEQEQPPRNGALHRWMIEKEKETERRRRRSKKHGSKHVHNRNRKAIGDGLLDAGSSSFSSEHAGTYSYTSRSVTSSYSRSSSSSSSSSFSSSSVERKRRHSPRKGGRRMKRITSKPMFEKPVVASRSGGSRRLRSTPSLAEMQSQAALHPPNHPYNLYQAKVPQDPYAYLRSANTVAHPRRRACCEC